MAITPKHSLLSQMAVLTAEHKICLAIEMPDGSTELIINQNAQEKLRYIERAYDNSLHLKSAPQIRIQSWMFYK
jgi:hypothetical protein